MVRPLEPPEIQVEDEDDEEIICTHLDGDTDQGQSQSTREGENSSSQGSNLGGRDFATAGLAAGAAGVVVPTVGTAGLTAVGFTGTGVAASSIAAGVQAGIGNVAAGSLFATCQSIGATGGFAILGPVGLGAAAVVGTTCLGVKFWKNQKKKREEENERRRIEEEEKAHEKLKNGNDGHGGDQRPMCSECRKKLLLRITKIACKEQNSKLKKN